VKIKELYRKNIDSFMKNFKEEEEREKIPPTLCPSLAGYTHFICLSVKLLKRLRFLAHALWLLTIPCEPQCNHHLKISTEMQKCCPGNRCAKQDF